ncbi:HNH endonuclease [Vibrio breoganii]|uniref:HNH endonuclease n=1 Tax=Vibrio breoganii TaxID=553239 RepID=UPI000C82B26E|nr:HNH endonuclease [Vibrio breoganii]PMG93690.1 HNH endonuclease [Vibrio breoganii]
MNRKQFIEKHGGECANWAWSWSFVNHKDKFVIFGAWDTGQKQDKQLILSDDWERNDKGRYMSGYGQALEHIDLILHDGYSLKTFLMYYSDENKDGEGNGPAKISGFEEELVDKYLHRDSHSWVACSYVSETCLPEEIVAPDIYLEGAHEVVSVNSYERNSAARQRCLDEYGYKCKACNFDFEETYGDRGRHYIHVHHIIPLKDIRKEYKVDPIKDLVPLCANCHAMVHRSDPALTVKDLKELLRK